MSELVVPAVEKPYLTISHALTYEGGVNCGKLLNLIRPDNLLDDFNFPPACVRHSDNIDIISTKLPLDVFTLESPVKAVDFSDAGEDPFLRFHIVLQADLGVLESRVAVVIPPVEFHHLFVLKVHYATERSEKSVWNLDASKIFHSCSFMQSPPSLPNEGLR